MPPRLASVFGVCEGWTREKYLERTLRAELSRAPGLNQVAEELGVGPKVLRYHFPELARAVSRRWRAGACECRRTGQRRLAAVTQG